MTVLTNPSTRPNKRDREVAAEIADNGGTLTAEEIAHTRRWEGFGWSPTKSGAMAMAQDRSRKVHRLAAIFQTHGALGPGWQAAIERKDYIPEPPRSDRRVTE